MEQPHQPFEGLDPATLAVRDVIAGSRELTGRMAQRMGMTVNDMSAIGELVQHGPMGPSELARRLGIRTASATLMIDRLERAGHVRRVRDTVDRRRVTVTETDAARQASEDAWGPVIGAIDDYCASLPAGERDTVLRFFSHLTDVITRLAPS
ncbi:MarR family winged helix-turn-helix transcriptional regulator [Kineococcus rubinsiae]|uniref:MarR family winged helix-turn-helix transcriptional regulator n=1 Tax=Kineococcus rubinsiae TaxID=2609562 RepID=UPI00142FDA8C|nr:MarR family transcriptional regulator [Kineococcus rubinsiae]NIZ91248.1 MarR family transcriptional regulator [Kineococcus rubinsiae]